MKQKLSTICENEPSSSSTISNMHKIQKVLSERVQFFLVDEGREYPNTTLIGSSSAPRGGGEGGTLIFSHIRRLRLFWGVQNSEFQYFWGFSEK